MANDFSLDPRCKALWRFEPGALTADSQGTNTLLQDGSPAADTVDYKEGSACVDLEKDSTQGFYIPDAGLDAGFPLKNGDSTKKISVCCWFKPESIPGYNVYHTIWAKQFWGGSKVSVLFQLTNNRMRFMWGYGSGTQNNYYDFYTPVAGHWYFVAIVVDGIARTLRIEVWDDTAGTHNSFNYTPSGELRVHDAAWTIGAEDNGASRTSYFDGKIDEVVVFNDLLGIVEIEAIRTGVYSYPTSEVRGQALGVTSAYGLAPGVQAQALGALVVYSLVPDVGWVDAYGSGILLAYADRLPSQRVFPVPHPKVRWQSQAGKRKFPVVIGSG